MTTLNKWLRRALAVATVVLAIVLCWQCLEIWRTGNGPANLDENGLYIQPVFRAGDVAARLARLTPLFGSYVLLAAAAFLTAEGKTPAAPAQPVHMAKAAGRPEPTRLRVWLYGLALLFILLGVMNGGLHDVLVKAFAICTECIGLG